MSLAEIIIDGAVVVPQLDVVRTKGAGVVDVSSESGGTGVSQLARNVELVMEVVAVLPLLVGKHEVKLAVVEGKGITFGNEVLTALVQDCLGVGSLADDELLLSTDDGECLFLCLKVLYHGVDLLFYGRCLPIEHSDFSCPGIDIVAQVPDAYVFLRNLCLNTLITALEDFVFDTPVAQVFRMGLPERVEFILECLNLLFMILVRDAEELIVAVDEAERLVPLFMRLSVDRRSPRSCRGGHVQLRNCSMERQSTGANEGVPGEVSSIAASRDSLAKAARHYSRHSAEVVCNAADGGGDDGTAMGGRPAANILIRALVSGWHF